MADFGLTLQGVLKVAAHNRPIKWTAPEALLKQDYSSRFVPNNSSADSSIFRSDVWSFGILMFELLTVGKNPYEHNRPRITNNIYKKRMCEELK